MSKELYLDEWHRLYNAALDRGLNESEAEAIADAGAYDAMSDRFANIADRERVQRKEQGP